MSDEILKDIMMRYRNIENEERGLKRLKIYRDDPDAPICINCEWCNQQGFLFSCVLAYIEDKDVGDQGLVYWKRKDKFKNNYGAPKKVSDCEDYNPLTLRAFANINGSDDRTHYL